MAAKIGQQVTTKPIDWTKTVLDQHGDEWKVLTTERPGNLSVVLMSKRDGTVAFSHPTGESCHSFTFHNPPEKHSVTRWVPWFRDDDGTVRPLNSTFLTEKAARVWAESCCFASKYIATTEHVMELEI